MMLLPLIEILVRRLFGVGVPGSGPIVQHLTLWVGFLGAAIAAREGQVLALARASVVPEGGFRRAMEAFAASVAACVAAILAGGGLDLVLSEHEAATTLGAGIPTWVAQIVLPLGFALIAVRQVYRARGWTGRIVAALGL